MFNGHGGWTLSTYFNFLPVAFLYYRGQKAKAAFPDSHATSVLHVDYILQNECAPVKWEERWGPSSLEIYPSILASRNHSWKPAWRRLLQPPNNSLSLGFPVFNLFLLKVTAVVSVSCLQTLIDIIERREGHYWRKNSKEDPTGLDNLMWRTRKIRWWEVPWKAFGNEKHRKARYVG